MSRSSDWAAIEALAIKAFHREVTEGFLTDVRDEIMEEKWALPGQGPDHKTKRKNQSEYPGLTGTPRNLDDTHELRDNVIVSAPGKHMSVEFAAGHAIVVHQRADFTIVPLDKLISKPVQI